MNITYINKYIVSRHTPMMCREMQNLAPQPANYDLLLPIMISCYQLPSFLV